MVWRQPVVVVYGMIGSPLAGLIEPLMCTSGVCVCVLIGVPAFMMVWVYQSCLYIRGNRQIVCSPPMFHLAVFCDSSRCWAMASLPRHTMKCDNVTYCRIR